MPTARQVACATLLHWTRLDDPPFLPERSDPAWQPLTARDRAFAFDLLTGVLRWRNTLDAVIASRLRQPLELLDLPVRAILWLGAYQLLFQSSGPGGVTEYAAVDTSVGIARAAAQTARAAGLVNAVLRNIARLRPVRVLIPAAASAALSRRGFALDFSTRLDGNADIFPDPTRQLTAHLAAVRSHPAVYVDHLRGLFGDALAAELLLRNNLRPEVTLRADDPAFHPPGEAALAPHPDAPGFFIAREGWNGAIEALVHDAVLSPQDPTAAKPVRALAAYLEANHLAVPMRILDLCAGLGTKTLQLARAFPTAAITATDVAPEKLARLADRARAARQDNIRILPVDALTGRRNDSLPGGPFDAILLDVPCSNTGVIAKRVQSRWRWPSLDRPSLHKLQEKLLAQAAAMLAPGGHILYATCSLDPSENGERVRAATPPLNILAEESTLPSLAATPAAPHDGGYYALLSPNPA